MTRNGKLIKSITNLAALFKAMDQYNILELDIEGICIKRKADANPAMQPDNAKAKKVKQEAQQVVAEAADILASKKFMDQYNKQPPKSLDEIIDNDPDFQAFEKGVLTFDKE